MEQKMLAVEGDSSILGHMRLDALKQYTKLRQQLIEEKSQIENRLNEINQALGAETTSTQATGTPAPSRPSARRGRPPRGSTEMTLRDAVIKALSGGPVARKNLVQAVEGVGYKFNTDKPLNSIGSVLYNKKSGVKSRGGMFYVEGGSHVGNGMTADQPAPARKKRRRMSAEGRAKIAAAARARWAKMKAGK